MEADVDGVPLDDLLPLPPPSARNKRKEPDAILDAEQHLKTGMKTALGEGNKGMTNQKVHPWVHKF